MSNKIKIFIPPDCRTWDEYIQKHGVEKMKAEADRQASMQEGVNIEELDQVLKDSSSYLAKIERQARLRTHSLSQSIKFALKQS
jgi:hypothetical protein